MKKLLYLLAKRFIAGQDFDSAKSKIKELLDEGYEVSIDYLGELSKTKEDCKRARDQYAQIINFYRKEKIDVSIKISQLGILINPVICYSHIAFLTELARIRGHTIRLDMEDSKVTSLTKSLAISLYKKYGNVGVAIQANLHRTKEDIRDLINEGVSVRLVKGAYQENIKNAHQDEEQIGACFFDYAAKLKSHKSNKPAIATHDEELLEDVLELIPDPHYFDYEFLYGIRRDIQQRMLDSGFKVRVYVPFGDDWLPYTLRRMREWKNLKFVIKNIFYEIFKRKK